jgi:hypothetical protein
MALHVQDFIPIGVVVLIVILDNGPIEVNEIIHLRSMIDVARCRRSTDILTTAYVPVAKLIDGIAA